MIDSDAMLRDLGWTAREYHDSRPDNPRKVDWTEPGLKITRLRLLSDPGFPFWDVSYCHGMVGEEHVDVDLPFNQVPKGGFRRFIVERGKRDGVFVKGLGLFDAITMLQD